MFKQIVRSVLLRSKSTSKVSNDAYLRCLCGVIPETHTSRGLHCATPLGQKLNPSRPENVAEHPETAVDEVKAPQIEDDDFGMLDYYIKKAEQSLDSVDDAEYFDILDPNKKIFFKLVDIWLAEAGETRRGHREFITAAMHAMPKFKVESDISAYVKLFDCYPVGPHTGIKRDKWFQAAYADKFQDHRVGEELTRLISLKGVVPNENLFIKVTELFGMYSPVTWSVRSMMFWYPRVIAFSKFPLSRLELEKLTPVEIAFNGLRQINPGIDCDYSFFEVDKSLCEEVLNADQVDGIISVQTPVQIAALAQHDPKLPVFIEGPHRVYYKTKMVQYFVMRADPKAEKAVDISKVKVLTTKEWWSEFYQRDFETQRPICKESGKIYPSESYFPTLHLKKEQSSTGSIEEDIIKIDKDVENVEGPIYAIASTDHKSPAALQSWVKGLVSKNEKLALSTVVFRESESFLINAPKDDPNEDDLEGGEDLLKYL